MKLKRDPDTFRVHVVTAKVTWHLKSFLQLEAHRLKIPLSQHLSNILQESASKLALKITVK